MERKQYEKRFKRRLSRLPHALFCPLTCCSSSPSCVKVAMLISRHGNMSGLGVSEHPPPGFLGCSRRSRKANLRGNSINPVDVIQKFHEY